MNRHLRSFVASCEKVFCCHTRSDRMAAMITALDHISINASDSAATVLTEKLLARKVENSCVQLGNVALRLNASADKEGLHGLAFSVDTIDHAFKSAERRALKPQPPGQGRTILLDTDATFGVPISLVERDATTPSPQLADSSVTGLDHVVIRTTHPNRAVALYLSLIHI